MSISLEKIKQLREETSVSVSDCKKALEEANGDIEKAKEFLRILGEKIADKKSSREVKSGIVESYIHPNKKVGVLIAICCESDFVAKSEEFQNLAHDICLQIAAMNPKFITEEDIPENILNKEKEIYQEQLKESDKKKEILENIINGKISKFKNEVSLLNQVFIKEEKKTIKELIDEKIAKFGENIVVNSFSRYEI